MSTCTFRRAVAADADPLYGFLASFGECPAPSRADVAAWFEDSDLEVAIGECGGELVGCGRLSIVGAREGWIGWQRVQQGARQQALLQALTEFQTETARRLELRVARAAWQSANAGMHKTVARLGYHKVASFGVYSSEALSTGAPVLSILTDLDYSAVQNHLGRSSILRAGAGLFSLAGQWMELTGRQIRGALEQGRVLGLRGSAGGLDAFAVMATAPSTAAAGPIALGYVDAGWQSIERLALALRGLARTGASGRIRAYLVDDPALRGAFLAAGFQDEWDGRELCIFERFL